ncbi:MAG: 50S ribosomal protein L10 [Dictyoglomus sp.]|nr:50S ribosomal protein L10 [Dictyoglomus sp.]MCX7942749.1 50S ribosomal protein L10 [Dictyoglomaceae bacterium]MDW8188128.1 50S ribosomal protein L10 [Dictyoglomus sp.]
MPKEEKKQKVEEIYQKLLQANSVIFTDFKGLTVADLSQLRTKLREVGAEYRVVKNTLALRAFQKYLPNKNVEEYLRGPTAFTYCYGDPFGVLKILVDFSKDHENLKLKGGIVEGELYNQKEIKELANLPPKDVLLSKLIGSINNPLTRLVFGLKWPINQLVWTLEAIKKEKEKNLEQ